MNDKSKILCRFGNFIVKDADKGVPAYRISTSYPMVEWVLYSNTFVYKLIESYLGGDKESHDMVYHTILMMFYLTTTNDVNIIGIVMRYQNEVLFNSNISDDETQEKKDLAVVKAVKEIESLFKNKNKTEDA